MAELGDLSVQVGRSRRLQSLEPHSRRDFQPRGPEASSRPWWCRRAFWPTRQAAPARLASRTFTSFSSLAKTSRRASVVELGLKLVEPGR